MTGWDGACCATAPGTTAATTMNTPKNGIKKKSLFN